MWQELKHEPALMGAKPGFSEKKQGIYAKKSNLFL
jgi:hypothetical protein